MAEQGEAAARGIAISVVVPCLNEEESLPELHRRLAAVIDGLGLPGEIVLVDDGSTDATWAGIAALAARDARVRGLRLSRNFGHEPATSAGLAAARGERALILDADLQDPPELLPEMMRLMDRGYDMVYGRRATRAGEAVLKLWTARAFYRIINRVADVPIPEDVGDFRLVNRRVLDAFLAMPERTRFVRGMFAWVGYRRIGLEYHRDPRHAGRTKYRLGKLVGVAADAITGFSIAPLRLATLLAYASLGAALLVAVYVAVSLALGVTVPGWSSIVLVVAFFSGVQLLTLGILGEYIGRLYVEAKGRPLYLVAERAGEDAGPPAGHAPARRAADG